MIPNFKAVISSQNFRNDRPTPIDVKADKGSTTKFQSA